MIRHRPFGSGHAYNETNDQRVPVLPLEGQSIELRAIASWSVSSVVTEWDDGEGLQVLTMAPMIGPGSKSLAGTGDEETHLSQMLEESASVDGCWKTNSPVLKFGSIYRYRFGGIGKAGRIEKTRWYQLSAAKWVPHRGTLIIDGVDRVLPDSVEWLVDLTGTRRVRFALPLLNNEHIVGFGERFNGVDQRGKKLDVIVCEQYKNQAAYGRTYLPMPFAMVLGGEGWSLHIRTSRRTWYDVGATYPDRLGIEVELGGEVEEKLEIAINIGTPAQLLAIYLEEVGKPEILPPWVFRLWASSNEWNTQSRVLEEMTFHQDQNIPVGVLVIEAWSDESTFTAFRDSISEIRQDGSPHQLSDFTFPAAGAWPDPKKMVDHLHELGIKVLLWQIPLLKMQPRPKGQAAADVSFALENELVVKRDKGSPYRNRGGWFPMALMPDFTSEKATAWWLAKRQYLITEIGIDGFKTDGGEHAWGADLRYSDGTKGEVSNNLFPMLYSKAYGELLRACKKAPVTFSRAGFEGSQSHGIFWAGDENSTWEAFRNSIAAGISASACGIFYWGWDLAGFSGEIPTPELYLRATAMSCFAPIMQYHSEFNHHRLPSRDRTPWNIAEQSGDSNVLKIFRRYAHLRERVIPYLVQQMEAGVSKGLPLMRGMFFLDPLDLVSWNYPEQYLLGEHLLIAPVTKAGATVWPVYLPPGEWVDVWTGEHQVGPREIERPVPISEIPVYCRSEQWNLIEGYFQNLSDDDLL
jgi:alpha-glucosidase (family GH31 glycosyl hydrolase)